MTNDRRPTADSGGIPGCDGTRGDGARQQTAAGDAVLCAEGAHWEQFVEQMQAQVRHSNIRRRNILSRFVGNNLVQLRERLRFYEESGDHGWLVDVAKFAGREWVAKEARRKALDELAAQAQELDMGYGLEAARAAEVEA